MSYYPIDTHATVREFEAAGIETKQAEAIVNAMAWSRNDLVTKEDLAGFATKADLAGFATKDDLAGFATKDDLAGFATKEDLEVLKDSLNAKMERFATKEDLKVLRAEMAAIKSDLEKQISSAVNKMLVCMISMSALIVGLMKYL